MTISSATIDGVVSLQGAGVTAVAITDSTFSSTSAAPVQISAGTFDPSGIHGNAYTSPVPYTQLDFDHLGADWTLPTDDAFLFLGALEVEPGRTLTVPALATLAFDFGDDEGALEVAAGGTLDVSGTLSDVGGGQWGGVTVDAGGTFTATGASILNAAGGVRATDPAALDLEGSTLDGGVEVSATSDSAADDVTIQGNAFDSDQPNSDGYAVSVDDASLNPSRLTGNTLDGLQIAVTGTLIADWTVASDEFVVVPGTIGGVEIPATRTLTVDGGDTLGFADWAGLDVTGQLDVGDATDRRDARWRVARHR